MSNGYDLFSAYQRWASDFNERFFSTVELADETYALNLPARILLRLGLPIAVIDSYLYASANAIKRDEEFIRQLFESDTETYNRHMTGKLSRIPFGRPRQNLNDVYQYGHGKSENRLALNWQRNALRKSGVPGPHHIYSDMDIFRRDLRTVVSLANYIPPPAYPALSFDLPPMTPMAAFEAGAAAAPVPGFSRGGRPRSGQPIIVGEHGPEVFIPDRPGRVVPNNRLSSARRDGVTRADAAPQENTKSNALEKERMREMLDSAVRDILGADLARRGPIARGLEQTYGLNRAGVMR